MVTFGDIPEVSFEIDTLSLLLGILELDRASFNTLEEADDLTNVGTSAKASRFRTTSALDNVSATYNLYYHLHQGKKNKDRTLSFGYRLSRLQGDRLDTMYSASQGTEGRIAQSNGTTDREQTIQLDYWQPLKHWVLETEAKGVNRNSSSQGSYLAYDQRLNKFDDVSPSTFLENKQRILSFYNSYYLRKNSLGIKFGLRYEHTILENSEYGNIFGNLILSASYQRKFKKDLLNFSYDQELERPAL